MNNNSGNLVIEDEDAGINSITIENGAPNSSLWVQSDGDVALIAGNLGVGIADPGAKLHVEGSVNIRSNLAIGEGINMWQTGWDPAYDVLHIGESVSIFANNNNAEQGFFGNNLYAATSGNIYIADGPAQAIGLFGNGNIGFLVAPAGLAGDNLVFAEAVTIANDGNIGINYTTPGFPLEVRPVGGGRGTAFNPADLSTWVDMKICNPANDPDAATGIMFLIESVNYQGSGIAAVAEGAVGGDNPSGLAFMTQPGNADPVERMRIDRLGRVGIGRQPAINLLEVNGMASKSIAGDWAANSDIKIKTDIHDLENALDVIDRLHPVRFKYRDDYRREHPSIKDRYYYNFIAQEYQQVFPDSVWDDGTGLLQVDAYNVRIYLVKAMQELRAEKDSEISDLRQAIKYLEEEIKRLK